MVFEFWAFLSWAVENAQELEMEGLAELSTHTIASSASRGSALPLAPNLQRFMRFRVRSGWYSGITD
jgi:hypothetical protein